MLFLKWKRQLKQLISHTEKNDPINLQYERFLNIRDCMCTLHDFTCMCESVETNDNSVNIMAVCY